MRRKARVVLNASHRRKIVNIGASAVKRRQSGPMMLSIPMHDGERRRP